MNRALMLDRDSLCCYGSPCYSQLDRCLSRTFGIFAGHARNGSKL